MLLYHGPLCYLAGIGHEELDDCCLLACFFDVEEILSRNPAVCNGLVIRTTLALSDYNLETVVPEVQTLAGTLDAITDNRDDLVLEYFARVFECEFFAGDYILIYSDKINFCNNLCCYCYFLAASLDASISFTS